MNGDRWMILILVGALLASNAFWFGYYFVQEKRKQLYEGKGIRFLK